MAPMCVLATALVFAVMQVSEASYEAGATGYSCPTLFNYYGDVHDCTKFYRCVWGQAFAFTCGAGTRWNQYILTCDHEYNVPCSNDPGYISAPTPVKHETFVEYDAGSHAGSKPSSYDYTDNDGYNAGSQTYYYKNYNDGYPAYSSQSSYGSHSSHGGNYQRQNYGYGYQPASYGYQPTYGYYNNGGYLPYSRYNFLAGYNKKY